jgi:hypothetical protein
LVQFLVDNCTYKLIEKLEKALKTYYSPLVFKNKTIIVHYLLGLIFGQDPYQERPEKDNPDTDPVMEEIIPDAQHCYTVI